MASLGDDHWIHVLFCCSDLQSKLSRSIEKREKIKLGESNMSIFDMGEYNFYVWTSVFISFLALFLAYYDALKKHKDVVEMIKNRNQSE